MTNTNANTTKELVRANKLSVRPDGDHFVADFYRTHAKVVTIASNDTAWMPTDTTANKSAQREEFRSWIAQHANTIGIKYDPEDRRTESNQRLAHYVSDDDVAVDVRNMIRPDIEQLVSKMPYADLIAHHTIGLDDISPMTTTGKGTPLSTMGVIDGKYEKTGYWAWADLDIMITLTTIDGQEIYYPMSMQLVSGQLKKAHITQTAWNTQTHASLVEIGLVTDEKHARAEGNKAEDAKVDAEDAKPDIKGEHTTDTATSTEVQPKAKKTRKTTKKSDKAE